MHVNYFYLNDRVVTEEEARISVLDLAILRGYGVFEYLRTYKRIPFRLWDHLDRLQRSADELGVSLPKTLEEIASIVYALLLKVPYSEASIRVIVTGGISVDFFLPMHRPQLIIIVSPLVPLPRRLYEKGMSLVTEEYLRVFSKCKSTNYLSSIISMQKALKKKAHDVLFFDKKLGLLEATTANFFAFKKGILLTPSEGILKGETRQIILEQMRGFFPIEIRRIFPEEIPQFEGAFLTSSYKEIMPVTQIDNFFIGTRTVHPFVRKVMTIFQEYISRLVR